MGQISKLEVADSVVNSESKKESGHFSKENLKEIFSLNLEIEKSESIEVMAKSMSEWTVCRDAKLIKNVIPIENDEQIQVMFERSVDPQTDRISKTDLLIQKEQVIINKDVKGEEDGSNDDDDDDDEVMESDEYVPESDED